MIRFNSIRQESGPPPETIGRVSKDAADKLIVAISYDDVLDAGDYPSTIAAAAVLLSDRSTVATTTVINASAKVEGTVQSGSTTTLVTAANQSLLGVELGDDVVEITQGWQAKIRSFSFTALMDDTFNFGVQAAAAANPDTYATRIVTMTLKAGTSGLGYLCTMTMTANGGQIVKDTLLLQIN